MQHKFFAGFSKMQDDSSSSRSVTINVTSNSTSSSGSSSDKSLKSKTYSVSSSTSSDENDNNLIRTRTRKSESSSSDENEEEVKTQNVSSGNESSESDIIFLPGDPREWEADHIEQWLTWATKQFKIDPPLQKEKFPETGEEVCKMTKADFWVCAGTKYGAEKLAKYLAHSLYKVTGKEEQELLSDEDPSKYISDLKVPTV